MKIALDTNIQELFEEYTQKFPKLPSPRLDGLRFEARRPKAGEIGEIFKFYATHGHYLVYSYGLTMETLKDDYFDRKANIIYAILGDKVVGQLVLTFSDILQAYIVTLPCTHQEYRNNDISIYMTLCAMKFARKILKVKEVIAIAYPPEYLAITPPIKYQRTKSLDIYLKDWKETTFLIFQKDVKPKARVSRTTERTQFEHERLKYMYHVFEEILGKRLYHRNYRQYYSVKV